MTTNRMGLEQEGRLSDDELVEIISGSVEGCNPTTQEISMARELLAYREASKKPVGYALTQVGTGAIYNTHQSKQNAEMYRDLIHQSDDSLTLNVTPLYAAPPVQAVTVPMKDHQIREWVNELRDIAVKYHGTQQLRERIARSVRSVMLKSVTDEP